MNEEPSKSDNQRKTRSSSRIKKVSSSMRIVDEETRRIVQQNRIDALEADNLFDNLKMDDEDGSAEEWNEYAVSDGGADEVQEELNFKQVPSLKKSKKDYHQPVPGACGTTTQRKTRSQPTGQGAPDSRSRSKHFQERKSGGRQKINLAKVFYQEFYDTDTIGNFQNYLSVAAKPSKTPARFFCSVCGYWANYQCTRCGLRYCCMKCSEVHRETRCIKFAE